MVLPIINFYLIILIYGSLILLSFLLLSNPLKVNKKANFYFGIFLFLWSTFWLEEVFELSHINILNAITLTSIRFIQFLTPLFFYFSVVYYTNPDNKFKKSDLKYLLLPLLFLSGLIFKQLDTEYNYITILLNILIIIQAIYFIITSYIRIQRHKKKIELFASKTTDINLNWIEYIIISLFILSLFIAIYNILFVDQDLNLIANIVSLIIIFFVGFNALKQKEIFLIRKNKTHLIINENNSTKRKLISDQHLEDLKTKLLHIMTVQQPFLDPELTLVSLADLVNVPPHQLSYVINSGFNENFFLFVNKYRVEKVKSLLLNKDKNHLTIMAIAFESGFNSKTSFNTTFKKICSQTPSEFKKSSSSL
ncbi:AraC family transcriptional regulator [Olleya sp. HaHaR_3_96]|nr:AraC family transcriptional regulator [Olleya sp. HaHaR_3_96]